MIRPSDNKENKQVKQFEVQKLSFSYADSNKICFDSVDLSVDKGEYVVILGRSGSAKTTFLRHLKPGLAPFGKLSGKIFFNSIPINQLSETDKVSKIGFVMQDPDDQIVTDKVWHELAFGPESLGWDQKEIRAAAAEMASYFGIQNWFHRKVSSLSGGQKQLLNLASVMITKPEVLILDEPTAQLDPIAASDFLNTVRKINIELGTTIIITEHRLEEILPYANRAVVMENGRIIADDTPKKVAEKLFSEKNPMASAMPAPVRIFYGSGAEGISPLTVREGREWLEREFTVSPFVTALHEENLKDSNKKALEIRELWFRYDKDSPDILRGVDLSVEEGTLHCIVGGNGTGKSTTLKACVGICPPYRGKIKIFGRKISKFRSDKIIAKGVALLCQNPKSIFTQKTVIEELYEMTRDEETIKNIIELCDISHITDSHPYDISGGEMQRVALAKVLLRKPRLLLLDEPTKGMDSFFKESFADIVMKLKESGVTVLMVSHDIEFCGRYADKVSMFFDGSIITTNTPKRFFAANSFYTTTANRMSRHIFNNAVTAEDVIELYNRNRGSRNEEI